MNQSQWKTANLNSLLNLEGHGCLFVTREVSLILTASVTFLPIQNIQEIRQLGINEELDFHREGWSHKGNQCYTFVFSAP